MASFKDFISTLSSDSGEKGQQFERFVKWFLVNDPVWKTQIEQVWHWAEYPNRWGKDLGIDLVFKTKSGDLWAVQAKCYAATTSITKAHVDSFISEADSKTFAGRLLIGTTDSLADNAKKVCDRQNVTRFLLADFESSSVDFPDHYGDLLKASAAKPPQPRDHQLEAIKAVSEGFKGADRGQLIMACGTGKTFTTLWIKEALEAESTLILLPSLGLLSQTLHEWTKAASKPFEVLCVCSDDSVGKKGDDENYDSVFQLPFPVTSDSQRIKAFLEGNKSKVVFSTYQSSPLVADAQATNLNLEFDLIVADEAHRCAGVVGDGFSSVLNGQRLRGKRRLFATATPRTYSKQIKSAAEGRGVEVVGMDDEAVFGKPLYTLSFGEAIERKLLTDYRVVIVGVDDAMLASWIENREIVRTETGIQTDAKSLASTVGLLKAINDYDLHRLISFHSRVKGAEAFAKEIHEVQEWLPQEVRLKGKLNSDYVSGEMPTDRRRQKLSQLKNVADGEAALLSNARCLSEGVDIPSLDGVAFIDPKNSQIDIIQAVGRAIRLSTKKTAGTIVLPVFIESGDTTEEVIQRSEFKHVWGVLAALKAHDETFANELNHLRTEKGRIGASFKVEGLSKVVFNLPRTIDASFSQALRAEVVNATTASWDEWLGKLQAYVHEYGDALVPSLFQTSDGFPLGAWVVTQRGSENLLSPNRRARLEGLKHWTWNSLDFKWERGFRALQNYIEEYGDARVVNGFKSPDGFKLGVWVSEQRTNNVNLSKARCVRLESLPGWTWNTFDDAWDTAYDSLRSYADCHEHLRMNRNAQSEGERFLARWTTKQRTKYSKGQLTTSQIERLENISGWSWDPRIEEKRRTLQEIERYFSAYGHANIPASYQSNGIAWGNRVSSLRANKDSLLIDEVEMLDRLNGWSWNPKGDKWQSNLHALLQYVEEHGTAQVPNSFRNENGVNLGKWLEHQRAARSRGELPSERIVLLEEISGWSWQAHGRTTEFLDALNDFVRHFGHSRVPQVYVSPSGVKLGGWVQRTRSSRAKLDMSLITYLETLPGWVWEAREARWLENLQALQVYAGSHGHANVPAKYVDDVGRSLGTWVSSQKINYDNMSEARRSMLEAVPGWSWKS